MRKKPSPYGKRGGQLSGVYSHLNRKPSDKFLSADVAMPISRLADIVEETHQKLKASGLVGSCLGHVGDGMFPFFVYLAYPKKC